MEFCDFYNLMILTWNSNIFMIFHNSHKKLFDFHDFRKFLLEFYDFLNFHHSQFELYVFHYVYNSVKESCF